MDQSYQNDGTASIPERESPSKARLEKFPAELKATPQWVVWKFETRDSAKPTKVPYNARTHRKASSTDPRTWSDFQAAIAALLASNGNYHGVGFVVTKEDPYAGIDLDNCRNAETGVIEAWAVDIVRELDSYTEVSPSETGLRIFVRGAITAGTGNKKAHQGGAVEMYGSGRYFTVTGKHVAGAPMTVEDRAEQVASLHARLFPRSQSPAPNGPTNSATRPATANLSDDQILDLAARARNGFTFTHLMSGDTSGNNGDDSAADLALCNILAFYTRDPDQIDRLFRLSGLMRDKWEREDYRNATIQKAIDGLRNTYQPESHATPPRQKSNTPRPRHAAPGRQPSPPAEAANESDPPDLLSELQNDHGNAERLIKMYGDSLRYCHQWKTWLVWDGARWAVDDAERSWRFAKKAVLEFLRQAINQKNESAEKFARNTLDARWIYRMLSMARSEIPVRPEGLDRNPWLINFTNGTFDVSTGQLRPHCREDFITKVIPHSYNASATAPTWLQFLDRAMNGNQNLQEFLRLAIGYSMTGTTREKVAFFCHGDGDNGKTTFLATMRELLNDYAQLLAIDTLMTRQESNNSQADLADLCGARFVCTTETEEGQRLSEGKLKRITQGMGTIKAVRKWQNPFEFEETHKLWLDCNHLPIISTGGKALWRRVRLIPWTVSIPRSEQDPDLARKLHREGEGILAWAISGAVDYYRRRLSNPPEVTQANTEYQDRMDQLKDWLDECCTSGNGFRSKSSVLYESYRRFAENNGHRKVLDSRTFKSAMVSKGFPHETDKRGAWYTGVAVRRSSESVVGGG